MRKLNYLIIVMMIAGGFLMQSCNKDKDSTDAKAEISFTIEQTDFDLKSSEEVPMCVDSSMDYVVFKLGQDTFMSPIMYANGSFLTQTVKVDAGINYSLTSFLVYHDVLPIGQGNEDILIKAAPASGSIYHDLMTNPLDLTINIAAFTKKQFTIDVLCYEDLYYDDFGFTWFDLNEVVIERVCIFGDICVNDTPYGLDAFEGSAYADQSQGLQYDMPAIFRARVRIFDEDTQQWIWPPASIFTNIGWQYPGEGNCLEVYWANDIDKDQKFRIILAIWQPKNDGSGNFHYKNYKIFEYWNNEDGLVDGSAPGVGYPVMGADGVIDFVVGGCSIGGADYEWDWK